MDNNFINYIISEYETSEKRRENYDFLVKSHKDISTETAEIFKLTHGRVSPASGQFYAVSPCLKTVKTGLWSPFFL